MTLGSSSNVSKSFLVRHILSEIIALAQQLWQSIQVNSRHTSILQSHLLRPSLLYLTEVHAFKTTLYSLSPPQTLHIILTFL